MNKLLIKNLIDALNNMINSDDIYLLKHSINERSITHRYAFHLQKFFPGLVIDCEYNKMYKEGDSESLIPKKIFADQYYKQNKLGRSVFPDVIIHERGTDNNYVVIEAKKSDTEKDEGKEKDIIKLKAYKKEHKYKYAFYICFPVKESLDNNTSFNDCIQEIYD